MKSEEFIADTDSHFKKAKFINFNIIHHQCRGDPLDPNDLDKSVRTEHLKGYDCKQKIVASAIRLENKEINIEKKLVKNHFTKNL